MNIQTVQYAMIKRAKERTVAEQMAIDEMDDWDREWEERSQDSLGAANAQGIDTSGDKTTIEGTFRQGKPQSLNVNGQNVQVPSQSAQPGSYANKGTFNTVVNQARSQGVIKPGGDFEVGSPEYNAQRGNPAAWTVNGTTIQPKGTVQPAGTTTQPQQRQAGNQIRETSGFRQN
jgi:hypothetical protein